MRNLKLTVFLLIITGIMAFSCDKEKGVSLNDSEIIKESCNLKNPIKSIYESMGTIWYSDRVKAYCIFTSIEGTYDTVNVGVVCNLPDNYKKDGLKVVYSGSYFKYELEVPLMPGETFYSLELSKIKLNSTQK